MFSFLHCADLHLDSPFKDIGTIAPSVAARLREATFAAFENVVDAAVGRRVDFLLIAGDVYDGEDRSLRAQLRFRDTLCRAAEAGIDCFVIHGNHDPLSGWATSLELPENVYRFEPNVTRRTVSREGRPLADIYGVSYPQAEVTTNLVPGFDREREDVFSIGLLHCNVGGRVNDSYAPCSVADLEGVGYDYWALGHAHTREIIREEGPRIVYPGNTQGLSVRETGPRGCQLVTVDAGGKMSAELIETDVVRWFVHDMDIGPLQTMDELLESLENNIETIRDEAASRASIVRLTLSGRGPLHTALGRIDLEKEILADLQASEAGRDDFVWIESLRRETRPEIDIQQRRNVNDFVGDFLKEIQKLRTADDAPGKIREILLDQGNASIRPYLEKLTDAQLLAALDAAETTGLDNLVVEE